MIFASKAYAKKLWPKHELKQAQERAFRESREYLLPLRIDDTKIPGVPETVGYLDLRQTSLDEVADLLLVKLRGPNYERRSGHRGFGLDPSWDGSMTIVDGVKMASFWPKRIEAAQKHQSYFITVLLRRIRYGEESSNWEAGKHPCHDCGAVKGQYHVPGCDVEECPNCGEQAISCDCHKESNEETAEGDDA